MSRSASAEPTHRSLLITHHPAAVYPTLCRPLDSRHSYLLVFTRSSRFARRIWHNTIITARKCLCYEHLRLFGSFLNCSFFEAFFVDSGAPSHKNTRSNEVPSPTVCPRGVSMDQR